MMLMFKKQKNYPKKALIEPKKINPSCSVLGVNAKHHMWSCLNIWNENIWWWMAMDILVTCPLVMKDKLQNVFLPTTNCICPICTMYLCELPNEFVWIAKCICVIWKMYLCELLNIFVWIANCKCNYQDDLPPVMKDKSKNAARNRREKENGRCSLIRQICQNILRILWELF